jgi:uncharacterized protein (TIGR02246 family)
MKGLFGSRATPRLTSGALFGVGTRFVSALPGALLIALPLMAASPEAEIKAVLATQVEAWNRADVESFMTGYAESEDILFVGKEVKRGYKGLLERYRRDYPDAAGMGKLRFSDLEVRMLGAEHATVLGRYHLTRTEAGGGDATGIFTLIFEKTAGQWKIIQDHTTALATTVAP